MKRHINYNSIEQFRTIVKNIQHSAQYVGYNEETKEPFFDRSIEFPKIEVTGTEKVHGSNAAACYSNVDGFWVQSRSNILTPESDNAGCAFIAYQNQESWMKIIYSLASEYDINLDEKIISVFYEWSGGNIQKNSCVSGLDKRSIIFEHFKVSPVIPNEDEKSEWYETKISSRSADKEDGSPDLFDIWLNARDANIFNVCNFPTINLVIDFNRPDLAQNEMVNILEENEHNSPIGQSFGIYNNILEGYVFTFKFKDALYKFKVKGEKHANSKVKTLKPVDSKKEQLKIDVATKVTPAWRLEQMFDLANDTINNKEPDIKNIGDFIKRVNVDIIKEELDVITSAGLEPKEIFGKVAKIIKIWYQDQLDKSIGIK